MKKLVSIAIISIYLICFSTFTFAQPGFPGNPQENPDAVPLQGLVYLLVGGLILGVKKIMSTKKDNHQ